MALKSPCYIWFASVDCVGVYGPVTVLQWGHSALRHLPRRQIWWSRGVQRQQAEGAGPRPGSHCLLLLVVLGVLIGGQGKALQLQHGHERLHQAMDVVGVQDVHQPVFGQLGIPCDTEIGGLGWAGLGWGLVRLGSVGFS